MMRRLLLAMIPLAMLPLGTAVHSAETSGRLLLVATLGFEDQRNPGFPVGWEGSPAETISLDNAIVHSGQWAVRLTRDRNSRDKDTVLWRKLPVDFTGKTIELRGFLRTEDVSGLAGLTLSEQSADADLEFAGMEDQHVDGTTGWKEYSIRLPLNPEARTFWFGVALQGTGTAWADDLQLLVDGKPIAEAPVLKTVLDSDHRFDGGSGVALTSLSPVQIANLTTLGKVWGFLKYHHPAITSGRLHWDYELLGVLPAILNERDTTAANAVLARWISGLGAVERCNPCVTLDETDLHLRPDTAWIEDESALGAELSRTLRDIYANRRPGKAQFYVSLVRGVGNPAFEHEPGYAELKFPDPGYQLLALYRFWNIIQYWFPYRDVIGEDWHTVLGEFVPRIALARNKQAYKRELIALMARAHDTHANLWSGLDARPPTGRCRIPVTVQFVEGRAVVTGFSSPQAAQTSGLRIGDVIDSLNGVPVATLVERWSPYYAASNEAALLRDIGVSMTRGACGDATLSVLRDGQELTLVTSRTNTPADSDVVHDLPGDTFRLLSPDIAYLKLSSVKSSDVPRYVEQAAGTKGLVVDIRNYPSEFVTYSLGALLVDKITPFARFTLPDPATPGAFRWMAPVSLTPSAPHYHGKVAILVDEASQSNSEFTAMAFRSASDAVVVGSTTAGADGDISAFSLPGGQRSVISGIGVFYPDETPTQRVGIIPDITVRPTIAGIRAGRDEVLEAALRHILGNDASAEDIERTAHR